MHLADAFIQSDLHCIQVTVSTFYQLLLSLGLNDAIKQFSIQVGLTWMFHVFPLYIHSFDVFDQ